MKNLISFIFFFNVITSCSDKNLIKINEFNLKKDALIDGEEIEILCSSENPENGNEEYYIHMIVKSISTNDTVNLLFHGSRDLAYPNFTNFISPENDLYIIMANNGKIKDGDNVKNLKVKQYTEVYSNPQYIALDWKKYPSIIGFAAKSFDNKPVNEIIDESMDKIQE